MRRRAAVTTSIPNHAQGPGTTASSSSQKQTSTEQLVIKLSHNCDISVIHASVLACLSEKKRTALPNAEKELSDLHRDLESCMCVPRIRQIEIRIAALERTIRDNEDAKAEQTYITKAEKIFGMYQHLLDMKTDELSLEKIIEDYLSLASCHIPLVVQKDKKPTIHKCRHCGINLTGVYTSVSGVRVCPRVNCQTENHVFKAAAAAPKEYNVWGNLLKAYERFIGDTELKNINVIMADLDIYFGTIGKPSGEYYRKQPVNEMGRKDGTSHHTLCDALSVLKYKTYYKNYMYIGHMYYGWELQSLDHLLPEIKRNFDRKQAVWETLTPDQKQGQSNLSTEFRMCMELNHVGILCDTSWFNISTTQKTLEKNYSVYTLMCHGAGFEFPHPYIGTR